MAKLTILQQEHKYEILFEGTPLLSQVLAETGISIPHPCGGLGYCGKCRVQVKGVVSTPNALENKAGVRLACQVRLLGDACVVLSPSPQITQIQMEGTNKQEALRPMPGRVGAAVDLGTTTLTLMLYNLSDGICLASSSCENPQTSVAADVMGRIKAALDGELFRMQSMIESAILRLLQQACQEANIPERIVQTLVIAGNTTMLYLLTGRNPLTLSRAPFEMDHQFGEWIELLGRNAYIPPCINAFLGADIVCAVLSSKMCQRPNTAMLVDIGTNGEIALWKNNVLWMTSAPAGPVFEGAGIFMGCGSIPGAVDSVWVEKGLLKAHSIGNAWPVGICGSGLIDAIASLLDLGVVEYTGTTLKKRLHIMENVYLIPADVRNVQLAKAAIAAGIRTIIHQTRTNIEELNLFYLAGGFGSHLDIASATRIGLIPQELSEKVVVIGNAALAGATSLLLDCNQLEELSHIVRCSRHVPLGGNPQFNEMFMEEMLFPET